MQTAVTFNHVRNYVNKNIIWMELELNEIK